MNRPLRGGLRELSLLLLLNVLLLSIAGRMTVGGSGNAACHPWSVCIPESGAALLRILHVLLGATAGMLMLLILRRVWIRHRSDEVFLPLAAVTGVLFLGQAFVGAVLVSVERLDLVVLHVASAVGFWVALLGMIMLAWMRPDASATIGASSPAPRRWQDFLSLTKPWIVGLLLLTTLGGLIAGGRGLPPLGLAFWTLLGGAMAASGASALNQYIDRELDKRMQRTAGRPLPAGRLTAAEGLAFGLTLCLLSYFLLAVLVNFAAAMLSLAGIFYYVIFYSVLLKRATVQNIVIGGGAGAIPPMVGWAAATGGLSLAAWILFLIIFMWTPPHFWALAIVRMKDYEKAGVPMLPVVKGERSARRQILLYTLLLVVTTLSLPAVGAAGEVYTVAAIILGAGLIIAAWRVWRIPGNKVAWTMYRWSSLYLMFMFAALMVDAVL